MLKCKILCVVLMVAVFGHMVAQVATLQSLGPQARHLPVLSVHRIMQDTEGYLWYGTVDGLCRDDGYDVRVFRNDYLHPAPLRSNLILCIAEDSLHRILFGTPSGAFFIDKTDYTVQPYCPDVLGNKQVQEIFCRSDGTVFLSTAHATYVVGRDQHPVQTEDDVSSRFFQTADGTLLSAFYNKGLCRYEPSRRQWTPLDSIAAHLPVSDLAEAAGYLWLTTRDRGMVRLDMKAHPNAGRYVVQPEVHNAIGHPIRHFFYVVPEQNGHRLWATSLDDLHAFDIDSTGTLRAVDLAHELRGYTSDMKMMNELIRTRDGSIWIAGYDRQSMVIDFETFNRERYSLPPIQERFHRSTLLLSLSHDADHCYWVSQERVGLGLYDLHTGKLVTYADCPSTASSRLDFVHELMPSSVPHQVWTVTATDYVYGVTSDGMQMYLTHSVRLPDGQHAKTVFEDHDGTLWIGTYDDIFRYTPATHELVVITDEAGQPLGHTTSFTQTQDGTVYATVTGRGIAILRNKRLHTFHSLPTDLLCIASMSDGTLWIGTGDGRLLSSRGDLSHFDDLSEAAGMNGDMVEKIVCDPYNHLWILTNSRLTEFDPHSRVYRVISTNQTLSLSRFMPRALSIAADGDVLVGGFDGFLVCHPSLQLEGMARPVPVVVTDLRVEGMSVPISLPLSADARDIEIHFSSLDHLHAVSQRYAYRLDDGPWTSLRIGANSLILPRIARGEHQLLLRATDPNGLWSSEVTTFCFSRQPYWYENTLAFLIYIIGGVLLLVLVVRYFMRRSRRAEPALWQDSAALVAMHDYVAAPTLQPTQSAYAALDQMLLDRARDIVGQHLSETDFGVNDLADSMNMSRSTLVRKLKAITGQTPLQFIRNIKMEAAREMLQQRTATVADVARRLGFSDREHFAHVFREVTGVLPSEVRRSAE
ncbi:MAG: helix-turn-helix domain-containing protein [Bacteroidales bacterium]|nr:helix-turn-helix domain-containing protein [Bacteroidales bacterium]